MRVLSLVVLFFPTTVDKSLRNRGSKLKWRPDLILADRSFVPVSAYRVGGRERSARSRGARLWISDHAGVIATMRLGH